MTCICTIRPSNENKAVHLVFDMQIILHTDIIEGDEIKNSANGRLGSGGVLQFSETSLLYTEFEASINMYWDPITFDAEKLFERNNTSMYALSKYHRLNKPSSSLTRNSAICSMRLRYHPATWNGTYAAVETPHLKVCCIGDKCCSIANVMPHKLLVPVGSIQHLWVADSSSILCVVMSTVLLVILTLIRK